MAALSVDVRYVSMYMGLYMKHQEVLLLVAPLCGKRLARSHPCLSDVGLEQVLANQYVPLRTGEVEEWGCQVVLERREVGEAHAMSGKPPGGPCVPCSLMPYLCPVLGAIKSDPYEPCGWELSDPLDESD